MMYISASNIFSKIIITGILLLTTAITQASESPIIAAAASTKFALQDIAEAFSKDTGKTVRFSFASSGSLYRQIQQGAPFELFLSANSLYIDKLHKKKRVQQDKFIFALGRLVLLTSNHSKIHLDAEFNQLKKALQTGIIKRLAIANPEHAPFGIAAKQALQHQGLWPVIQTQLVLGENVAQAAQFANSGAAQVALVSYSLALAPALKNNTRSLLVPQHFHQPLEQTMVLLNNASKTAKQFHNYLLQDKAKQILSRYGYTLP